MHQCVAFVEITEMVKMADIQLGKEFDSDMRKRCITLYSSWIESQLVIDMVQKCFRHHLN